MTAASTVTGSKYLIEHEGQRLLVDCGLFQGYKNLRLLNWQPFHFDPASLDAVVLTHAHLDHSGALPLLIRNGFRGPVYATPATIDLCGLLLPAMRIAATHLGMIPPCLFIPRKMPGMH